MSVRSSPHIILMQPERGGGSATKEELSELHTELHRNFIEAGMTPARYGDRNEFLEAIAYRKGPCAHRSEQILIDYGGSWLPLESSLDLSRNGDLKGAVEEWFRSKNDLGRILTVLVRDGGTTNKELVRQVEEILIAAGVSLTESRIAPSASSVSERFRPDDVVFAVTIDIEDFDDDGPDDVKEQEPIPERGEPALSR